MLIQLTLLIFLAQSGAEWKLVRSNAWCARNFHGTKGIVISAVVSAALSVMAMGVSPTFAGAFAISGLFGMFTNELTFAFYEGIHNFWHKGRNTITAAKEWKNTNASRLEDAKVGFAGIATGVISIFALIGKIIRGIGWICTRPAAISQWKANRPALSR